MYTERKLKIFEEQWSEGFIQAADLAWSKVEQGQAEGGYPFIYYWFYYT